MPKRAINPKTIYFTKELAGILEADSEANERSLSAQVVHILKSYYQATRPRPQPERGWTREPDDRAVYRDAGAQGGTEARHDHWPLR